MGPKKNSRVNGNKHVRSAIFALDMQNPTVNGRTVPKGRFEKLKD